MKLGLQLCIELEFGFHGTSTHLYHGIDGSNQLLEMVLLRSVAAAGSQLVPRADDLSRKSDESVGFGSEHFTFLNVIGEGERVFRDRDTTASQQRKLRLSHQSFFGRKLAQSSF